MEHVERVGVVGSALLSGVRTDRSPRVPRDGGSIAATPPSFEEYCADRRIRRTDRGAAFAGFVDLIAARGWDPDAGLVPLLAENERRPEWSARLAPLAAGLTILAASSVAFSYFM